MYSDKFVVAIKAGGKILRETKDLVQLPFGSEFSVLVKNLNSRRAVFTLHIDGQDVLDGTRIVVNANAEVEMKRFIRNGNMDAGNAFKFIERTQAIEDGPRGVKVDDGVVRVEFWFEKAVPEHVTTIHHHYDHYRDFRYGSYPITKGLYSTSEIGGQLSNTSIPRSLNAVATSATVNIPEIEASVQSDVGITVPGSKVDQKFTTTYGFNSETSSNVIVLRIAGLIGEKPVAEPVTVKTKLKCETCGTTNKANAKFCSECGTSLELV